MVSMSMRATGRACALACGLMVMLVGCGKKEAPVTETHESAPPAAHEEAAAILTQDEAPLAPAPSAPTNMRPVRVTVLEYGSPAAGAEVWIEHFSPTSSWWHARTRGDGRATLLVPVEYTWFRVSASKAPNAIAAQFMRDLPPRAEPLDVTLNMTNQGVTVTALLEAARPELLSNVTVRIRPENDPDWEDVSIARVPNTSGPRVILPPIRRGLKRLRIEVMSPRCATSFSEPFDTLDGRDKIITVKLLEGVRVYGTARLADGTPAGSFTLFGTPAGTHGLAAGAGVVRETLTTDANGAYECAMFIADFYRLQASCNNMQTIRTNLLISDDGTQLDLVFPPQKVMPVRGRVLFERTQQPAPNVIVRLEGQGMMSATTDVAGVFVMQVPYDEAFFCALYIAHEGYAETRRYVYETYRGEELVFLLRDTAHITGTISYEDGTPASGVFVRVDAHASRRGMPPTSRVALGAHASRGQSEQEYEYESHKGSDASGMYVISNVAAPETYQCSVYGASTRVVRPREDTPAVEVAPGEVARCDLVVQRTPQVWLKVCDAQGAVLREYDVMIEHFSRDGNNTWGGSTGFRARPNANGWQQVPNWGWRGAATRITVRITTPDGATAHTNDVNCTGADPIYITLIAVSNTSRGLCGYVYDANEEPLIDVQISADYGGYGRMMRAVQTDHLGFFELPGSGAPTSITVRVHAWYQHRSFQTNVLESATPLIWVLDTGRIISGRVCIEHAGRPATNFAVGLDMYNCESFTAEDGRFTLYVQDWQAPSGMVYAWVGEYAPARKPYALPARGGTDVGDIIVQPLVSSVRGRVVDERGAPVAAMVTLQARESRLYLQPAMTDDRDGTYEFTRLPAGDYQVSAYNAGVTSVHSAWFGLAAGQTYTVPDLVISMTNATKVRLVFVKADGTPAAHMHVSHAQQRTDAAGAIEEYVRLGRHENWILYDDRDRYYAEPFEVTPGTRELRIALAPNELIEGTVTIDGTPVQEGLLHLTGVRTQRTYGSQIGNGTFACNAEPGPYYVTFVQQALVTTAELVAGGNNTIAFVSGDAALTITLPAAGRWYGSLSMDMNGRMITTGSQEVEQGTSFEFQRLQAGRYKVSIYGQLGAATTNLQCEVQLSRGQRASVTF